MTPASALSRLEKLAEEYWIHCPLPAKGSENYANEVRSAFNAGGKALLQILSEPGEACGPRRFAGQGNSECSDTYATLAPLFPTDTAYVPESLLAEARRAARAGIAKEVICQLLTRPADGWCSLLGWLTNIANASEGASDEV